jgi:hypothetical protein
MKILVACEFSGVVRNAFRKRGHDAVSADLLPADDNSDYHYTGDVLDIIGDGWDMMIAHPPCTYLSNSGVRWLHTQSGRWEKMRAGSEFFKALLDADIPMIAVENPVMHKYALAIIGRKYDQTIQPYQFGHDASKRTCFWLKGLPLLKHTKIVSPKIINGRKVWGNQTPSGQNKLGPSADRWKLRSITYQGIADAMAEQWA